MADSASQYLIISCDGGGIRGLITALLLDQLSPSFLQQAYLFSGTSTGGIIALALASGISTSKLVQLYSNDGAQIFTTSACFGSSEAAGAAKVREAAASSAASLGGIWDDLWQYLFDLVCVKYDNGGLQSVINSTLGGQASATIGSLDRNVMVTTLRLFNAKTNAWAPLMFHNIPNITDNPTAATKVIDAAMSTSAAPTYFPPYNHPVFGYCADGGVVANNPAVLAASMLIESGIPREQIWMLSLSTGDTINSYPPSLVGGVYGPSSYGPFFWLFPVAQDSAENGAQTYTPSMPLTSAVFDGVSDINDYMCSQILAPGQYVRANVPLNTPVALDDYSQAAITAMQDAVTDYVNEQGGEWAGILNWISTNFPSGQSK
ncbi:MAG TPA: patatin-like phospholipase family protein [Pyrinomonadaceae bacterium]|nr:patatin-like phospholipase family protein [Pyrinomonadaceae bacterium]